MSNQDIVILSNGPGEITTWVLPVVRQIKQRFDRARISLILSPCPHATGNEVKIASQWKEIDRIQSAQYFFDFLLWGKTADNWDWYSQGLVIFLGGDQFFTVIIAKRLGFKSLVYAEWSARWYRYIDYFAVMNQAVIDKIPSPFQKKCIITGDLMADVTILKEVKKDNFNHTIKIGLLPGSKASKLTQGVPFLSAIGEYLSTKKQNLEFILPVAPTISPQEIVYYGERKNNPLIDRLGNVTVELREEEKGYYLETSGGVKIKLITEFPAYEELINCQLCLTTVGANTAQLGALAIPMIVLIPLYQLEAMKSWDGLPGILANLPIVGDFFAKLINSIVLKFTKKKKKLYAWPNLWAKRKIIPELIGYLTVEEVGNLVLDLLYDQQKLVTMKDNLKSIRGESGASIKIAEMVNDILTKNILL